MPGYCRLVWVMVTRGVIAERWECEEDWTAEGGETHPGHGTETKHQEPAVFW